MNIIKEINRLPNFGYVFCGDDCREHLAILGGHSSPKTESYEWAENIFDISYRMQDIYSKTDLSEADKTELAQLMNKMHSLCESRKAGLFTIDEQEKYLNGRSEAELKQIEKQELICKGWFLPPNTYDCGSFVVNRKAVVGKEQKKSYNRYKFSTERSFCL